MPDPTPSPVVVVIQEGGELWVTAVVTLAAALIGAAAAAWGGYKSTQAIHRDQRQARTAIRRKAKLYTPLRAELFELYGWLEQKRYSPIFSDGDFFRGQGSAFFLWMDMQADGRSLSIASGARSKLNEVLERIHTYNRILDETEETMKEVAPPHYVAVTGDEEVHLGMITSLSSTVLRNEPFTLGSIGPGGDVKGRELLARLNEEDRIQQTRRAAEDATDRLRTAITAAVHDINERMRRIAERYEQEQAED